MEVGEDKQIFPHCSQCHHSSSGSDQRDFAKCRMQSRGLQSHLNIKMRTSHACYNMEFTFMYKFNKNPSFDSGIQIPDAPQNQTRDFGMEAALSSMLQDLACLEV